MDSASSVHTARGIAWMALVFSVIALLFAISAYGVSRTKAEDVSRMDAERSTVANTGWEALQSARIEARQELESARTAFESNGNVDEALMRLNQAEVKLSEAFNAAGEGARQEWERLKPAFEDARRGVRQGSSEALRAMETLIERVAELIRTDQ